jgi:hypothetical protein
VINLFFLIFFVANNSWSQDYDECRFYIYCGGGSRSTGRSLPSTGSAANLNPSNISQVKGVGLESLFQARNPVAFSLVTGNGKIGALVSPTLENSFFGNRLVEIDDELLIRKINKYQYKNNKLNLAAGLKVYDKKNVAFDIGFSAKRNPDIKKINLGAGLSMKFYFFNFGAYFYDDDVKIKLGEFINPYSGIPYASIYNAPTYQEKFSVETYTMGAKLGNLSLDTGVIKTRYRFYSENTRIYLHSGSYTYKNFLFNLAVRKEYSPNLEYIDKKLIIQRKKESSYFGVQNLLNEHVVLGLQYNYFLLNEWSATLSFFL